jgi:N5-methyltetrahydromethanopterin:coenzyme M methyltransferase subunit D
MIDAILGNIHLDGPYHNRRRSDFLECPLRACRRCTAAMAQATGIGTGTVQLAAGAGLTGLVSAGFMMNVTDNLPLILASGAVGAMIMIAVTMIVGSWVYVYGVVLFLFSKSKS